MYIEIKIGTNVWMSKFLNVFILWNLFLGCKYDDHVTRFIFAKGFDVPFYKIGAIGLIGAILFTFASIS